MKRQLREHNLHPSQRDSIYVHPITIGKNAKEDAKASWWNSDSMNVILDRICTNLTNTPQLKKGFNALGLSQGGLFLRALVQKCSTIKVFNLVTLGSPHMGVAHIPGCSEPKYNGTFLCKKGKTVARYSVYNPPFRTRLVPAQYFKVCAYQNFSLNVDLLFFPGPKKI